MNPARRLPCTARHPRAIDARKGLTDRTTERILAARERAAIYLPGRFLPAGRAVAGGNGSDDPRRGV